MNMSDFDSDGDIKDVKLFDVDMDTNSFDFPSPSSQSTQLSTSNNTAASNVGSSLPLILTNEYFVIVDQRMNTRHQQMANGVIAMCQGCQKKISGSTKVTSNFLQHIKTKHPERYQQYLREKNTGNSTKCVNSRPKDTSHLTRCAVKGQNNFDEKVLKFVIETCSPLSIVQSPAFMSLFEGTCLKVDSESHITDLLNKKYEEMILGVKSIISRVDQVCCTADIWIDGQKSFFGYTCHWIESDYKRRSAALACRRFSRSHTHSRIGNIIHEIHTRYGITDKQLVCIVTDNGSNFAKAFKDLGVRYTKETHDDQCEDSQCGYHDDPDTTFDSSPLIPQLSKRVQCASHMLNLLATADFLKALHKGPITFEKHQQSIKRCTQIWMKSNWPKDTELHKQIPPVSLITPVATRWTSLYDAIKQLLSFSSKLTDMTTALGLESFEPSEIEYLEEYCQLMQPIAEGLDFLQKEEDIYFGYLAPTLLTLKAKLYKFANSPAAKYLKDVSKDMQDALIDRFRSFFELQPTSHDAVVAAITCPTVKIMNCAKLLKIWKETAPKCTLSLLQDIFVKEVNSNNGKQMDIGLDKTRSPELTAHPFFILEDSDEDENVQLQTDRSRKSAIIIDELRNFLENGDSAMSSLNHYPIIKQMFYKFNTALPSSAPVEKLFSYAEITNDRCRQDITNEHFEKLVIANINELIK